MGHYVKSCLFAGLLLIATIAVAEDQLPRLPSDGPEKLPSLAANSFSIATLPDKTISVTCYLGNPNNLQSLGSIVVNSPTAAGPSCNSMNYACQGHCFGCYSDFDLSEDVCVDNGGRRFIK